LPHSQIRVPKKSAVVGCGGAEDTNAAGEGIDADVDLAAMRLASQKANDAAFAQHGGPGTPLDFQEDRIRQSQRDDHEDGVDLDANEGDLVCGGAAVAVDPTTSNVPNPLFVCTHRRGQPAYPLLEWIQDVRQVAIWAFPVLHPLYPSAFSSHVLPAGLYNSGRTTGAAEGYHDHLKHHSNIHPPLHAHQWAKHVHSLAEKHTMVRLA
jgi:hypothetical protein